MLSNTRRLAGALLVLGLLFWLAPAALAAPTDPFIPALPLEPADEPGEAVQTLQLLVLLTILTLAPAFMILTTAFTRIVVVMGFLRSALGTQQLPPNQVLIGLALFLTIAVMAPTFQQMNTGALQPYLAGELSQREALERAAEPLKEFMFRNTKEADLALMLEIQNAPEPEGPEDVGFFTLVPAFVISELKTAFTMGFLLFLPFVIIDLIVASTMMSMGMMMVPPTLISLPFKILLFVLVDGWHLVVESLIDSFVL